MPSSGFHANGYSLIRHIIESKKLSLEAAITQLNKSLGETLLTPTEIYTLDCLALMNVLKTNLRTFVHITGGGIADNTSRVIPEGLVAIYDRATWQLPVEMQYMAEVGQVPQSDMERTWNCGIGMSAIVEADDADLTLKSLAARGMKAWVAGEVTRENGRERSYLSGTYKG